jgi:hypothetical protein
MHLFAALASRGKAAKPLRTRKGWDRFGLGRTESEKKEEYDCEYGGVYDPRNLLVTNNVMLRASLTLSC